MVLARSAASPAQDLDHVEVCTSHGLLTVFVHRPSARPRAAIVTARGSVGGVLGQGHALYQRLGARWSAREVGVHRVGCRVPNDLDRCAHDTACAVEMAAEDGAERVVVTGQSFGGAVTIRVAVVMTAEATGAVTFATQSAGCEVAGALAGRPAAAVPRRP